MLWTRQSWSLCRLIVASLSLLLPSINGPTIEHRLVGRSFSAHVGKCPYWQFGDNLSRGGGTLHGTVVRGKASGGEIEPRNMYKTLSETCFQNFGARGKSKVYQELIWGERGNRTNAYLVTIGVNLNAKLGGGGSCQHIVMHEDWCEETRAGFNQFTAHQFPINWPAANIWWKGPFVGLKDQ